MIVYILYFIISIIMGILLLFISIFNFKIRANYYHSYKQIFSLSQSLKNIDKKILLFHAASAGEYEQIQPILRGVDRTKFFIVQSFTSPSIYNIDKDSSLYDIECYHPFDILWLSYLFFKIINPSKYIITRHDIWPGHILMAHHFKIPIYYINANIHKNSIWYKKSLRFLVKYFFKKINYFVVPSQYISENLMRILPSAPSAIVQDTRFNQIIHLKKNTAPNYTVSNADNITPNQVIVFGSIDQSDEKLIFNILPHIIKDKKIILVPHEVDSKTILRIASKLDELSISYTKFSKEDINFSKDIILVDVLGLLSQLYAVGQYAYVGGGFQRGVHSVLEPAAYGCIMACGPNIEMLDEAKLFKNQGYLSLIYNEADFKNFINKSSPGPNIMQNISDTADNMINLLFSSSDENFSNFSNNHKS